MSRQRIVFVSTLALSLAGLGVGYYLNSRSATIPAPAAVTGLRTPSLEPLAIPHPPAQPQKALRRDLAEALGYGSSSPWERRTDIIRSLPTNLTPVEIDALLTAMMEQCPRGVSIAVHSTFIHEIALILQSHHVVRKRFARALATLAKDKQKDTTTRDYAMQHLREVWSRASDEKILQDSIIMSFHEFTELEPILAAPALLSLHILGSPSENESANSVLHVSAKPQVREKQGEEFVNAYHVRNSEIAPLLTKIFLLNASSDNSPLKMAAARIVSERRLKTFQGALSELFRNRSETTLVRMAAINAFGKIAPQSDINMLATYVADEPMVANALNQTLQSHSRK